MASSVGKKGPAARVSSGPSSGKSSGLNGSSLIADTTYRNEAKEAFAKVTKDTGNLDVLSRCKKLNEFLATVSFSSFCD